MILAHLFIMPKKYMINVSEVQRHAYFVNMFTLQSGLQKHPLILQNFITWNLIFSNNINTNDLLLPMDNVII